MRLACTIALGCSLIAPLPAVAADINWSQVDHALGKPGTDQPGGVHKYSLPRTDLHVTIDGVPVRPRFALGSWLAFKPAKHGAMVMGDLVLTGKEVAPVMTRLLADGLIVTALHNHLLRAKPFPYYMHVAGEGDPVKLARALHEALQASATPLKSGPAPVAAAQLDTAGLDRAMGYKGKAHGAIYHYGIARAETITDRGTIVPPAMGTATGINFEPLADGRAAVTGDLVLLPKEVPAVERALREHHIQVTAIHTHMLYEQPRLIFMHFWAVSDAQSLGRGLYAALAKMNVAPPR